jgi:hypothetical protein
LPEASSALATLLERAETGHCTFSAPERALFMACDFWVAVETRALERHLGAEPVDCIRYQGLIYGAIGAQGVSRALLAALRDLAACPMPGARRRCIDVLQERLADTHDPVDTLIAQFACSLGMGEAGAAAPPAAVAALRKLAG